jgi:hypothetical protein
MRMAEIREQYKGEWVLIKFGSMADLNEDLEVITGEVVAHAPSRDEVYRVEKQLGLIGHGLPAGFCYRDPYTTRIYRGRMSELTDATIVDSTPAE